MTKEMWKQGRPFTTALLYSAIFLLRIAGAASFLGGNSVFRADGQAPATSRALVDINIRLALLVKLGCAVGADYSAGATAHTLLPLHNRLAGAMHLHFPSPRAATHANIFQRAAHARLFMTLKVGKGNKYIGVHHSPANFCGLHILTATHRNLYIVAAL